MAPRGAFRLATGASPCQPIGRQQPNKMTAKPLIEYEAFHAAARPRLAVAASCGGADPRRATVRHDHCIAGQCGISLIHDLDIADRERGHDSYEITNWE